MKFMAGLSLAIAAAHASLSDWEQISTTINKYAFAIDTKDFGRLSEVFTPDAYANYGPGPWSDLHGLEAITQACIESVAGHDSQHLTTIVGIDIHEATQPSRRWGIKSQTSGPTSANSTSYDQSTLLAQPYYNGSVIWYYGYYADNLVKTNAGWRISERFWYKFGPGYAGNYSVGTT